MCGFCCGLNYAPQSLAEVLTPVPQHAVVFGNRVFKDVIKLKLGHWVNMVSILGDMYTQREDRGKTEGKDGHSQAKGRGHGGNLPCQHLDLRRRAPRTVRKYISMVSATQLVVLFLRQS